ncbi:MAG TPA: T9SS type A sorting domain-containing protein [Parafilimonas sp.]|nr:T9SS type A sorting domain-containing protein [Parafilimonas sp.]
MNKKILLMTICFIMINSFLFAQNWRVGGNANGSVPAAGGEFGTRGDRAIIFETNNTERGRLMNTSGFWGFGTSGPNAKVHINGTGTQDPFRVQVNGASKLYVDNNGGVSINSASTPPANGLFVSGNTGLGTTSPTQKLHVIGNILASGNLNATNLIASGNLDVSGTVGFGSVETFSDGGANTIQSNSDIVPTADNTLGLGSAARTWNRVHATSYFTTLSPKSLSTAENLKAGLPEIMKLRPISYTEGAVKKIGLIEKEVQSVIPEATSDQDLLNNENGSRTLAKTGKVSLEYDALIPVLIKGMQEQQTMIAALQEKITQLEASQSIAASDNGNITANNLFSGAVLEQNQPNPFSQSTVIRYRLPQNVSGQINIYDNNGKLLKTYKANESGQTTISAGELRSGIYNYTLLVNGRQVDTKKLVIAK